VTVTFLAGSAFKQNQKVTKSDSHPFFSNKSKKLRKVTVTLFDSHPFFDSHLFFPPTAGSASKQKQKVMKGDSHPFFDSHHFYPPIFPSPPSSPQKKQAARAACF
jgi:hypothetical protein